MPPPTVDLSAQFSRAIISEYDFIEAEKDLQLLETGTGRPEDIERALILAAIISYARPFLENKGNPEGGKSKDPAMRIPRSFTTGERHLHKKLMSLRHEMLAHSQFTRIPVVRTGGSKGGFGFQGRPFDLLSEKIDIALFVTLCRKLKVVCMRNASEANAKLPGGRDEP